MSLHCEVDPRVQSDALAQRLADSLHAVTKLKGEVRLVARGDLANDGKVIEDTRSYE